MCISNNNNNKKKTPSEGMDIKQKDLNFKNSLYSQNILKWITIS